MHLQWSANILQRIVIATKPVFDLNQGHDEG